MGTTRKEAVKEYKGRTTPRGIFAVRCSTTGAVWVGATPTLDTMQNRLWFMLRHGNHRNTAMQAAWTQHGAESFRYEILERLDDDVPAVRLADVLRARREHWMNSLDAAPVEL